MKTKKIYAALLAALLGTAALSATELEDALQQTAKQFSSSIKSGTTIAIVGISSDTKELSDFMLDEITIGFVRERKLTVANRANLEAIKTEMNFQLSGEVSDASIQKIGAMVGATVVVHGSLKPLGRKYNLTVQALDVTSATVMDMSRFSVEPSDTIKSLLDGTPTSSAKKTPALPKSAATPKPAAATAKPASSQKANAAPSSSKSSAAPLTIPKNSDDYHIIDISAVPKRDIEDRFIVYNRTDVPIQVAVYYVGTDGNWVYTGGRVVKKQSSASIPELGDNKSRPPVYGVRVADASGGSMNFLVSWDTGSHDLHVYVSPSFF